MSKRRICVFCECWESGGIESFLNNVLSRLDLSEFEVDIVTACLRRSVFTEGLEAKGIRFFELSGNQRNLTANHRLFKKLLRERRYDALHLNAFQGLSLYYLRLAKKAWVPVRIAHSHNTGLRKSTTRQIKLLLHRIGSRMYGNDATALWACSDEAGRFLFREGWGSGERCRVIPNGIDVVRFTFDENVRELERARLSAGTALVIGSMGRLSEMKNQEFLLYVMAELVKIHRDSLLLLVGSGEYEQRLRSKAKELGVSENVVFCGTTAAPERLMCAMDVFAFPSLFEGLGIAAIEAQASGLPVVCSERVPPEAYITPLIKAVELESRVSRWAEELLSFRPGVRRSDGAELVRGAGFDVSDTVKIVCGGYLSDGQASYFSNSPGLQGGAVHTQMP